MQFLRFSASITLCLASVAPVSGQEIQGPLARWLGLARRGSPEALAAIAATPTTNATECLLALLDTADKEQLRLVLEALAPRLPIPVYPDRKCPFTNLCTPGRRELSAKAWRREFNPAARDLARWLVRHEDIGLAGHGATIIACAGELDDTSAVLVAMDRLLQQTKDPTARPTWMPPWFDPFLMASQGQTYRGAPHCANPATPAEIVVYINKLGTHPDRRPLNWEDRCRVWLKHPIPYIRHLAAQYLVHP